MDKGGEQQFGKGTFRFPNSREHPARSIDNVVEWVNPRFADSLPVKLGERDDSVCFLVSHDSIDADTTLEVRSGHYRTGMSPGKSMFSLVDYPYRDQKGGGDFTQAWSGRSPMWVANESTFGERFGRRIQGIGTLKDLLYCAKMTERLIAAGVRPGCIISSVSRLREVPTWTSDGSIRMVPVSETRVPTWVFNKQHRGEFTRNRIPGVAQRHYSWPIRISDFVAPNISADERKTMVDATIEHVTLKLKKSLSYGEYLRWFAEDLGQSIARMHAAGLHHWYLHTQNVTADGGILDNDSAGELSRLPWQRKEQIARDHERFLGQTQRVGGALIMSSLFGALISIPEVKEAIQDVHVYDLEKLYYRAYEAELLKHKHSTT